MRNILRMAGGVFAIATATLVSACGSTPASSSTANRSDDGTTSISGQVLHQSPRAIDQVVVGDKGMLQCANQLKAINLPVDENNVDLGDSYVEINRSLSKDLVTTAMFTFSGKPLDVKAAYVTTFYIGDSPDFPGAAKQPGVTEKRDASIRSVSIDRDFTAEWEPGMEKQFSISEADFGHGHNDILDVVLCVQPS